MEVRVELHEVCRPSFDLWVNAMQRRCRGQAVTPELLWGAMQDELVRSAGEPAGALFQDRSPNGDEL